MSKPKWRHNKATVQGLLCAACGIDWASISQMAHLNDQWYHIQKSILLLQDRFVLFGPVSRRRNLPWLRAKHKRAQKSKHLAFIQYKSNPLAYKFKLYREESNKLSKLLKTSRRKNDKQLALKVNTQPMLFFAHVHRNRNLKKNIIGLIDIQGETTFTPSAQAELLKNFYASICRENDARLTQTHPVPTVVMPVPQFSIPVVHRELSNLDMTKEAGPDDIHRQMVRWRADFLANCCLTYSAIP